MGRNELVETVQSLIENENIKDLTKGSIWDFVKALAGDYFSVIEGMGKATALVLYARDFNFWSKMQRFLQGVNLEYDTQIKFRNKFCEENKHNKEYIQRLINMIEQLETDSKIDYYAKITRYAISDVLDLSLYFKFSQTLKNCTSEELEYLSSNTLNGLYDNSFMLDSLRLLGLVSIEPTNNQFAFTDYAKIFKKYCLNEESSLPPVKYNDIIASGSVQVATDEEVDEMMNEIFHT